MQAFFNQIWQTVGGFVPNLLGAILVLFLGWLIALVVAAAIRAIFNRTTFDDKLSKSLGLGKDDPDFKIEPIISKTVFWIIMLFVFVAVFQILGLTIITQPFNALLSSVVAFGSNILAAVILALIAWAVATLVRFVLSKVLSATSLDDKWGSQAGLVEEGSAPLSQTLASAVYWFIWLLFLPAILDALEMQGLLQPVQDMVGIVLAYLPNIFAAGLLILIGWIIARIVRKVVTSFASAAGLDNLGERVGFKSEGGQNLSEILGLLVYILILIPAIIAGLGALQIEAISGPATQMMASVLLVLPSIFWAALILVIVYIVAKIVSDLVTALLTGVGFDRVLGMIGLSSQQKEGQWTPSQIVGYLVMVGLMLMAVIEAANVIGFEVVAVAVTQFLAFSLQVLVALVILWLGLFLANLAYKVVLNTAGANAKLLATLARVAIVVFVATMALYQVGIAAEIVNLAFGLILGAIAIAAALAFGLGARETAGREVEDWVKQLRSDDDE